MMESQAFELPYNTVHLWTVHFKTLGNADLLQDDLLSEEERVRGRRFATCELREKFLYSHAILKLLLAKYLDISPFNIHYKYGLFRKPFVNFKGKTFTFNMSHSTEWAAYAFFHGDSIGVDIEERDRELSSIVELSDLICNEEEKKQLQAMACHEERKTFFISIWTAREAFLKMLGIGIGEDLSSIHFDKHSNAFLPGVKDINKQSYTMMGNIQRIVHGSYIASIACSKSPDHIIKYKLQDIADLRSIKDKN